MIILSHKKYIQVNKHNKASENDLLLIVNTQRNIFQSL